MVNRFCLSISVLFALIIAPKCYSQYICNDANQYGWFVPIKFARPFVAEMESPLSRVEEGFGRAKEEYTHTDRWGTKMAPYLNVTVGTFIPIWSMELKKGWSIGIDIPIAFHLWLDLETISAPVLNTDYRFAVGQIKALKVFDYRNKYLKNLSIRFAPYNHESTHIGDELTVSRRDAGFPITRVNVSYEYSELAVCLNDPNGTRRDNMALKFGVMARNNFAKSWFKIYANEGDTIYNRNMTNIFEFYINYEWQRSTGFATRNNMINVLSAEFRNRARYHYPTIDKDKHTGEIYLFDSPHTRLIAIMYTGDGNFFLKTDIILTVWDFICMDITALFPMVSLEILRVMVISVSL